MDAFYVILAITVLAVVWFIVKAVRQTQGQIAHQLRATDPPRRDEIARDLAARIREQAERVRCVRCGSQSIMLLGTTNRYRCESLQCQHTFDGPPHMPEPDS